MSFPIKRYMDNLFLNRMNSRQGIVKKKHETIFEISIGSLHYFKILLKIQFRYAHVYSNDPYATQTASDLKKDHPFRSPLRPGRLTGWKRRRRLYPPACKPYGLEAEQEAIFEDLGEKLPDPHLNKTHNLNRCNLHWTRSFIMSKASDKRLFKNSSSLINTINLFVSTVLT